MNMKRIISFLILLTLITACLSFRPAMAQYRKAILVVGDKTDDKMTQRLEALKKYLVYYRQKSGNDTSTLPIFVYDYSQAGVRDYCRKTLGIQSSDLLFLGIVSAQGRLPVKIHLKVVNPRKLENNARLVVEKFTATAASGTLYVTSSPPGAKVWLESSYKGITPLTIRRLAPGDYDLTLVKQGYGKTKQSVYVQDKKVVNVKVALTSSWGILAINSDPVQAQVFVDGVYYGKTPLKIRKLSPGEHKVVIKKDDRKWEGTALIEAGKTSSLSESLPEQVAVNPSPAPEKTETPTPAPEITPDIKYTPPEKGPDAGEGVAEAFIPKSETNAVFQVTVTNVESVSSIKDYYKPKPGYKFAVVYLTQQNVSNEVQIYTGKFSLVDQRNTNYEALDKLSNFWLVVLRPGGINMGYLVYEVPEDSKPMAIVLHGLNMTPLSVELK